MKEIKVSSLVIGDCLSKDVYNDLGNIILAQGTEITNKHIEYFQKHGIEFVYLNEFEAESPILKNYEFRTFSEHYSQLINSYKNLYFKVKENNFDFDANTLKNDLRPMLMHVFKENDILSFLRNTEVEEEYYLTHSVNVSILSAITAKWLNLDGESIEIVALAGLLHDIGKARVDHNIMYKVDKLSAYEMSKMREHSKLGYEIVKENPTIPRDILSTILFHHERCDGAGYPSGLTEEQTPYFARIVAVADVFDAITSNKVYRAKVSSFKAFSIIKDESFKGLDPEICEIFLNNIANFFVNNKVILNDGRIGDVVYINKYALNRPLIRVNDDFIDLSMDYSLDIDEVL